MPRDQARQSRSIKGSQRGTAQAAAAHLAARKRRPVHKQNFRRLMEQQELVEETGAMASETVGRPAKLFRFRHAVLAERAVTGTKLPLSRP